MNYINAIESLNEAQQSAHKTVMQAYNDAHSAVLFRQTELAQAAGDERRTKAVEIAEAAATSQIGKKKAAASDAINGFVRACMAVPGAGQLVANGSWLLTTALNPRAGHGVTEPADVLAALIVACAGGVDTGFVALPTNWHAKLNDEQVVAVARVLDGNAVVQLEAGIAAMEAEVAEVARAAEALAQAKPKLYAIGDLAQEGTVELVNKGGPIYANARGRKIEIPGRGKVVVTSLEFTELRETTHVKARLASGDMSYRQLQGIAKELV